MPAPLRITYPEHLPVAQRHSQLAVVAMPQAADKVRFHMGAGKERLIHFRIVETRHRPAIQTQRPGSQHQISPLQRAIAKASGAIAKSAGVTRLTITSVHCADKTVATNNSNGFR